MSDGFSFVLTSVLLGVGLAMDAFSVSLANGLHEPTMKSHKMCGVAGVFATFQFIMPLIGWGCVCTVTQCFQAFEKFIPWIALLLLGYIGGKMLYDGINNNENDDDPPAVGLAALCMQGIATSIDALSVGFTISDYSLWKALSACLLIGGVTFGICFAGLVIGKKMGTALAGKAGILGGVILIGIGLKIFIDGIL